MKFRRIRSRLVLVALLVTAGLAVLVLGRPQLMRWQQHRLASQLSQRIDAAQADGAEPMLRQLPRLSAPGFHELAAWTASNRREVAAVAREIVDEQFAIWQSHASENNFDFAEQATALASTFAKQTGDLSPEDHRWLEQAALKMVELPNDDSTTKFAELQRACDKILAQIQMQTGPASPVVRRERPTIPEIDPTAKNLRQSTVITSLRPAVPSASPNASQNMLPKSKAAFSEPPPIARAEIEPLRSPPTPTSRRNSIAWTPQWRTEKSARPLPKPKPATSPLPVADKSSSHTTPPHTTKQGQQVIDIPTPDEMAQSATALQSVSTDELLKMLPLADFYRAGVIRSLLQQRGISNAELTFSKQLKSDRVDDRLEMIDDLSRLSASSARRWLRELLHDSNAEVRLRALSAIATTGDPQLYDLARDRALNDRDTRIAELASRIMRQTQ